MREFSRWPNSCSFYNYIVINTSCIIWNFKYCHVIMAALTAIQFYRRSLDLLFCRLISKVAWPMSTNFATCLIMTQVYKIQSETWVPPRPKFGCPKISKFRTTSRLDRKYFQNATRHHQSENGVANYGHSRTGKLNSVYFGPQTAKTGLEFWPTKRAAIRLGIVTHIVLGLLFTRATLC